MRVPFIGFALVACAAEPGGPPLFSRDALTRHIDSLAVAAVDSGDTARASLLTDIEIPLAYGMNLAPIGIAIDSLEPQGTYETNSSVWLGVAYTTIDPARGDTLVVLVALEDPDAGSTLRARRQASATLASYVSGDSIGLTAQNGGVHFATTPGTGSCTLRTPVANPLVKALGGSTCASVRIASSDSLGVTHPALGSLASIAFGANLAGVALTDPAQSRPARRASASTTPFTNAALLADP